MSVQNGQGPHYRAEAIARAFHEAYERLAPSFGYETRPETRTFDPGSKNGRLMIAVAGEVLAYTTVVPYFECTLTPEKLKAFKNAPVMAGKVYPVWIEMPETVVGILRAVDGDWNDDNTAPVWDAHAKWVEAGRPGLPIEPAPTGAKGES